MELKTAPLYPRRTVVRSAIGNIAVAFVLAWASGERPQLTENGSWTTCWPVVLDRAITWCSKKNGERYGLPNGVPLCDCIMRQDPWN